MSREEDLSNDASETEYDIDYQAEARSKPARIRYFWATRPSQIFIHHAAKHLRERLSDQSEESQSVKELETSTLSKLRKVSVLAVKRQWVKDGIWDKAWDDMLLQPAFQGFAAPSEPKGTWDEWRHVKDARCTGSRPLDMFLSQLTHELRKAQIESESDSTGAPQDISSVIYNRIKNEWIAWGIWTNEWGVLPGLKWRHESSFGDFMKGSNWRTPIRSIPVPPGMRPSPALVAHTMDRYQFKEYELKMDAIWRYQKRVFEERQREAGESKMRTEWNDPDLSQRYHEWSYKN
ncbi:hypothetical protein F5Y18DRAFT_432870 [Xylariaceae sp. FL1019]|nr:hypothetical protein F5Y18DRAFT_432870 [Xylariaceae sp. FL1019]